MTNENISGMKITMRFENKFSLKTEKEKETEIVTIRESFKLSFAPDVKEILLQILK